MGICDEALFVLDAGMKKSRKAGAIPKEQAAKLAGLKQSDVSRIVHGNLAGYSTFRLISVLQGLGAKVTVYVEGLSNTGSDTPHGFALSL